MSAAIQGSVSGRATDDRTRICRAVLHLLEGLTKSQGSYLEALDYYQGEFGDADDVDQVMVRLKGRTPAVLVSVGGSVPTSKSTKKMRYLITYSIELAVVSCHWQSEEARGMGGADRFVDGADPGIYKILEDVRSKLVGRSLNIDGGNSLVLGPETPVYQSREMAIYRASYSMRMAFAQSDRSDYPAESTEVRETTLYVEPEQ